MKSELKKNRSVRRDEPGKMQPDRAFRCIVAHARPCAVDAGSVSSRLPRDHTSHSHVSLKTPSPTSPNIIVAVYIVIIPSQRLNLLGHISSHLIQFYFKVRRFPFNPFIHHSHDHYHSHTWDTQLPSSFISLSPSPKLTPPSCVVCLLSPLYLVSCHIF